MPKSQTQLEAESRARARAAAKLSTEGKYCCRFCKKERSLTEGLVISWGGGVLFGMCPECLPGRPLKIEERPTLSGERGLYVGFLHPEDQPSGIIPASDMNELERFVPQNRFALPRKLLPDV